MAAEICGCGYYKKDHIVDLEGDGCSVRKGSLPALPVKAERKNEGKIRYDLVPVEWEEQLAALLTAGAKKYTDNNWKQSMGQPESQAWKEKCLASLRRHLAAWQKGEKYDPEHKDHKIHHMTAVAWNALVIMWYEMNEEKKP